MRRLGLYLAFSLVALYFAWACQAHEPAQPLPAPQQQTALFPSLQWTPSVTYQAVPLNIAPYTQQLQLGAAAQQYQQPSYQQPSYQAPAYDQPSYRTSVQAPGVSIQSGGYYPQAAAMPYTARIYRRYYWTPARNFLFGRYRFGP